MAMPGIRGIALGLRRRVAEKVPKWESKGLFWRRIYTTNVTHSTHSSVTSPSNTLPEVKPFSEIPSPKGLPIIGTLLQFPKDPLKQLEFYQQRCADFFPIYRENMGVFDSVTCHDVEAIDKLFRTETKFIHRYDLPLWQKYRQVAGERKALLTSNGEEWWRMRRVVDKPMLRMKDVASYADDVNEVTTDFLARLTAIRGPDGLVPGLANELFNWSLESIGSVLYGRRFGGLTDARDLDLQEFIDAVGTMLATTAQLLILPVWIAKLFARKAHDDHMQSWHILFKVAKKCVDARMDELASRDPDSDEPAGVISYLLTENSLPVEEIYSNMTELMIGGVDTTSTSMLWLCEELAVRPDIQQKLLDEVTAVLPNGRIPSYKDLQNMPYLRAVVKELHRMHPIARGINRIVQESTELCGYHIPAKTSIVVYPYVINRLPQYFDNPYEFRPERWLRENASQNQRILQLTFGRGTRMCVGRRVAELELYLLLCRLIQKFSIEPGFTERAIPSMSVVVEPDRPIKIKLLERS